MTLRRGRLYAGIAGLAAAIASCSLIVERRGVQCTVDADCASFPDAACDPKTQACVDKSALACQTSDCVCNPTAPRDILNGCPKGTCVPFDNSRTKLGDGGLPPPPMGTGGGPPAPTFSCPGPDGGSTGGSSGAGGAPTIPTCEDLPSPLYLLGPGTIQPLLGWVAELYAKQQTTVVFQNDSSCVGVGKIYNQGFMENDPGNEAWTTYYDATGQQHPCKFVSGSIPLDIGLSDVFPQTCGFNLNNTDPNVVDTPGPVQAMGFIVPETSKQTSISAEAGYLVFAFGGAQGPAPWTNEAYIFQRSPSSGTQGMIGAAVGLAATSFEASKTPDSDTLAALVGCSPMPEETIGILAVDLVESGGYPIKLLSYQHVGQACGYLPDSAPGVNDKRNVRDGHYFIWGPLHLLTRKDHPNQNATLMINYVSGISPPPADEPVDIFKIWSSAHLVPQCAMHVTRSSDGGPLSTYQPMTSCSCKYDEEATGAAGCTRCQSAAECPASAPTCTAYNFCEP